MKLDTAPKCTLEGGLNIAMNYLSWVASPAAATRHSRRPVALDAQSASHHAAPRDGDFRRVSSSEVAIAVQPVSVHSTAVTPDRRGLLTVSGLPLTPISKPV